MSKTTTEFGLMPRSFMETVSAFVVFTVCVFLFSCYLLFCPLFLIASRLADSVMVRFCRNASDLSLEQIKQLGDECSAIATKEFKEPNLLEFESIELKFLIGNRKKRYATSTILYVKPGETYEDALKRADLKFKGFESKRRDNAKVGSGTQKKVLEAFIRDGDPQKACEIVKQAIRDVLMDRVDMSQYVISKSLSKTEEQYAKGGSKPIQLELAKRIKVRSHKTGEAVPSTGDRVPYVMIQGAKKSKTYENAENPTYAQKHKLPIDKEWYIKKQIMQPSLLIFTAWLEPDKCNVIKSNMPQKQLRQLKVYKMLFAPHLDHFRVKKKQSVAGTTVGIARFVRVVNKCMQCKGRLERDRQDQPLCLQCMDDEVYDSICSRIQGEHADCKEKKQKAWSTCVTCQKVQEVEQLMECSNATCDNFFHRNKVTHQLEELTGKLQRLHIKEQQKEKEAGLVKIHKKRNK